MTTVTTKTARTAGRSRRRIAAGVLAAALTVGLAACSDDDTTEEDTTVTTTEQPDTTEVPQVGSGQGLADTDYVALDQDALRVQARQLNIDENDPEQVLTGGLAAAFAWRPAEDSSQFDAFTRASSAWNNTYLRDNETRMTTLIPMSLRDWTDWGDRGQVFYPKVTITNETHPQDTDSDVSRVVTIDLVTGTEDDPAAGRTVMTVIGQARVHNGPEGWRIDAFQVRDTVVGER